MGITYCLYKVQEEIMKKKIKLLIISILSIGILGLTGCSSGSKSIEQLSEAAVEKNYEYIADDKTLVTTVIKGNNQYEFMSEPGDYGNSYCKHSYTNSDNSQIYYMQDGYIMLYDVNKDGTEYVERTHSIPTDYVWASKIPADLEYAIEKSLDGDRDVDVKVKSSKEGYTVSFNGPYSHNAYSATVELDSDYNFKSAVINRGDDKIEIPVLEFSDDKVDIPSIVTKTINEYKTEK